MRNIIILSFLILLFLGVSCNNKSAEKSTDEDTLSAQPFVPALPDNKDSTFISDTTDFGNTISNDTNFDIHTILDKHFESIGQDKLNKMETVVIEGKTFAGGKKIPFKNIFKRPNKSYAEVNYGEHQLYQGFNGEKAWRHYTAESHAALDVYGHQLEAIKDQAEFDNPLYTYDEKGFDLKALGIAEVEGREVYRIKMINPDKSITFFFIDKDNFTLVKVLTRIVKLNNESDHEVYYRDYRKIDGVMMAFEIDNITNNQEYSRIIMDKVDFNKTIPDDIFEKPEEGENPKAF